jgi:hypothetical protein
VSKFDDVCGGFSVYGGAVLLWYVVMVGEYFCGGVPLFRMMPLWQWACV